MRIDVSDLIDRPGASRLLERTLAREEVGEPAPAWGPADEALRGELELAVRLEMLIDGLLVRGDLAFTTCVACARCVTDVVTDHEVDVSEMFTDPVSVDDDEEVEEGYELDVAASSIDIEALVRDAILAVLWGRTLCAPDCEGLCSRCGADRNVTDCGHRPEPVGDPRWAVLQTLDLPPG